MRRGIVRCMGRFFGINEPAPAPGGERSGGLCVGAPRGTSAERCQESGPVRDVERQDGAVLVLAVAKPDRLGRLGGVDAVSASIAVSGVPPAAELAHGFSAIRSAASRSISELSAVDSAALRRGS